jgi:DNA ligase-1
MDLTKYTTNNMKLLKESEKETKLKNEQNKNNGVLIDDDNVKITRINNDEIEFFIKTKEGLKKYQNLLFFGVTNSLVTDSDDEALKFFKKSINTGVEGLMFKTMNSNYQPGLRTGAMAKLKETKEDIDAVILGAEYGKGKRAGFYSSFIIGIRNADEYAEEEDLYLEIGKVSSGILELGNTGHSMENLTNLLKPLKVSEDKNIVRFKPKIVLQVRYQEIQKSTTYRSGYALRFPRIISLRDDKDLSEINSVSDIECW